jgi:hypothetical protein
LNFKIVNLVKIMKFIVEIVVAAALVLFSSSTTSCSRRRLLAAVAGSASVLAGIVVSGLMVAVA